MANGRFGNKIWIEETGTVVSGKPVKVAYILFTPDATSDQMVLRETSSGSDCFFVRGAVAKDTICLDFHARPIIFQNGIHVQTLTSGAKAVLITTEAGE